MATSIIRLYQTDISPEKNMRIDAINSYLATKMQFNFSNFQYIRPNLSIEIKVNLPQSSTPNLQCNYLEVFTDNKSYYYFITSTRQISTQTVGISGEMDTINTFWNDLTWTAKTKITREHTGRFIDTAQSTSTTFVCKRVIDEFEEGITPTKYLKEKTTISADGLDYYLIYKNKAERTANTTVPIDCFCCASQDIPLTVATDATGVYFANYNQYDLICAFSKDNAPFSTTIGGTKYTIGGSSEYKGIAFVKGPLVNQGLLLRESNSVLIVDAGSSVLTDVNASIKIRVVNYKLESGYESKYNYYNILGIVESMNYTESTIGSTTGTLNNINTIDRTDISIVKIIKLPYAPFTVNKVNNKMQIPDGWTYSNGYLLLKDLNSEFLSNITTDTYSELTLSISKEVATGNTLNSQLYESKLYNSNFYSKKYWYDTFDKEVFLERAQSVNTQSPGMSIYFKPSNNLSSKSIFKFAPSNMAYSEPVLYGEYLSSNRQNEVALYNDDYLNYIRTGYNYDIKSKNRQLTTGLIGTGISVAGAIGGFLAGGPVGAAAGISLATSTIGSLTSTIGNTIANEENINRKLEELRKNAASVSNTDDIDLLAYYNGNKLIKTIEEPSKQVKESIYNLFRLTGYACDYYGIPSFTSRKFYNFIQCEPDFEDSEWGYGNELLDDIKARFRIGVTVYHKYNNKYDFDQKLENFESWLLV